ncbi:hypothetical protein D3C72_1685860 [compost metagenome]
MITAEVDDIDVFGLQAGDDGAEILVARIETFVDDFGDAACVDRALEAVGEALAVGGLVVEDGDALVLEVLDDIGSGDLGLLVVTAAGAQHVPEAAGGQVRRGCRRRHHQDAVFGEHVGGRHRGARQHRADDEADAFAGRLVCDRHGLLRVAGVVHHLQDDLLAVDAAGLVDLFGGRFRAVLDLLPIGRDRAGERRDDANGDIGKGERSEGDAGRQGQASQH